MKFSLALTLFLGSTMVASLIHKQEQLVPYLEPIDCPVLLPKSYVDGSQILYADRPTNTVCPKNYDCVCYKSFEPLASSGSSVVSIPD